jgi:hypothetical protein
MAHWNKEGIPHKGWRYVDVEDLAESTPAGEKIRYEQCQMCNYEKIRYVHILIHPDYDGEIRVGRDCACKMTDNYTDPELRERTLRNKLSRRQNFLRQDWQPNPKSGNLVLRYLGEHITIFQRSPRLNYVVAYHGRFEDRYCGREIYDLETAKLLAFELFDEDR